MRLLLLCLVFSFQQNLPAQTDTLHLLFAGDVMGHIPQIKSAEIGKGKYDYTPCFRHIRPVIERADIAVANLELSLPGKPPYTGYPMFRSPDALAEALKSAGFDLLVTANNHSNDGRGEGVKSTIATLQNLGFWQTGTFRNQAERNAAYPLVVSKNGFRIAFLNATYGTNEVRTQPPTIVNLLDTVQLAHDLWLARQKKPDFIIAIVHWGLEYQLKENDDQRAMARFLISHGADLVIGSHPHVVQPIKLTHAQGTDGTMREALVVYSLGNFISNQTQPNTDGGILFQVDLLKKRGGKKAELGDFGFLPVWRYIHRAASGKATYFTLPVSRLLANPKLFAEMAATARASMAASAEKIRARLVCPEVK